ncbi:hypothetical protein [Lutibacter sp. B1]|uniref:hypothetical protein n=1 Tax=Lutibacter sp. B1 TaxID=2725996 RepID=UPI0014565D86|nr:hypothetical protein [Lutibacter sp. B1]NLP58565.1 hypothetical protein [Lutibacter sp. B1]
MSKEKNGVGFSLAKINTMQFAIIKDSFKEGLPVNLDLNIKFGLNVEHKVLSVFFTFKLLQEKNPFLIIEVGNYFNIDGDSWSKFIDENNNTITFPKGFASHLVLLTIGTTRGVLHSKTENTPFNKFVLPTINVNELIKSDVTLKTIIED